MAGKALTPSLEDYMESILILGGETGVARVRDLAKQLGVAAASVALAVKRLLKEGLVEHERYGYIRLTTKGLEVAKQIYEKHKIITAFFTEVLSVPEPYAEVDGCTIEHHLSDETIRRMKLFVHFFGDIDEKEGIKRRFDEFVKSSKESRGVDENTDLSRLTPGEDAEVVSVGGDPALKHRLISMGFTTGETVKLNRIGPVGEPFEVEVKGSRVSLRKDEAKAVRVRGKR